MFGVSHRSLLKFFFKWCSSKYTIICTEYLSPMNFELLQHSEESSQSNQFQKKIPLHWIAVYSLNDSTLNEWALNFLSGEWIATTKLTKLTMNEYEWRFVRIKSDPKFYFQSNVIATVNFFFFQWVLNVHSSEWPYQFDIFLFNGKCEFHLFTFSFI